MIFLIRYKYVISLLVLVLTIKPEVYHSLTINNIWTRVKHRIQNNKRTASASTNIISFPTSTSNNETIRQIEIDEYFMNIAVKEAKVAYKEGEVPIGAVLIQRCSEEPTMNSNSNGTTDIKYRIVSKSHNKVEQLYDASAHAELLALREAGKSMKNWRLNGEYKDCTLYSTLEPCPMCLSAALAFRVSRVVYGAKDYRLGAVESYMNLLEYKHPYHHGKMEVLGGVEEETSRQLLVGFFKERRNKLK